MKILLKNIHIIHPEEKLNETSDILIINGIIKEVKRNIKPAADVKVFNLEGKYAAPGFFDMHVHFREPGREDEETVASGSDAAANGGFTGVACMPNTNPAIDSAQVVKFIKEKAESKLNDVFPIAAATIGRKGEALSPIAELKEAGVVALSDDGVAIKTAFILRKVLEYASMFDLTVIDHCEEPTLAGGAMNEGLNSTKLGMPPIPSLAEELIVARDILVAEYLNLPVHIAHISSKNSVRLVREAKARGVKITAEVTPHHFTLTDDALISYDTNFKMNPPLRTSEDIKEILLGLKDGTIDAIASDHAPHSPEEKQMEFIYAPNGIVGLETSVGLAFTELFHKNILDLNGLINKLAIAPRKILGIPLPSFKLDAPANITILDTELVWAVDVTKFKSLSKNSPFDKKILTGKAIGVINNNQMLLNNEFFKLSD